MSKKNKFIILLIILGGVIMFIHILRGEYRYYWTYCKDYYSVVAKIAIPTYKGVIEANGKPDQEWERMEDNKENARFMCLKYEDGRIFGFWINMDENPEFCNVEITNPEYRFGRRKIGIGTEKKVIEQVYKNSYISLIFEEKNNRYYAEDGKCGVTFYFDNEDRVSKIMISTPPIYHEMSGWIKKTKD